MELSESTINILKNFAGINANLVVGQGNVLQTIAEAKNVLAKVEVPEQFPQAFGIYDLTEFLGVLNLVDTPRLKFDENSVTIGDSTGRSKVKYFFSDIEMLTAPAKDVNMPEPDVTFTLDNDTLSRVKRAAGALGHSELCVTGDSNSVTLVVTTKGNSTANTFTIDVEGSSKIDKYNFVFNIPNLKILSGDYQVSISSKLISEFKNKENGLKYWIALEKNSTYGE